MLALQKMSLATFHIELGLHSMCMSQLHALYIHHAAYFIPHVHVPTITCLLLRTLYTSHVHYTVGSLPLANNAMHSPSIVISTGLWDRTTGVAEQQYYA